MFAIAATKARDARRTKARYTRRKQEGRQPGNASDVSELSDLILDDLVGSNLRADVIVADDEEKRRFDEALPEVISGLPVQQRAAATAFLECYQELRERNKYGPLAEVMSDLTGDDITPGAAKSALRGAMENIRKELVRRGISFLKGSVDYD